MQSMQDNPPTSYASSTYGQSYNYYHLDGLELYYRLAELYTNQTLEEEKSMVLEEKALEENALEEKALKENSLEDNAIEKDIEEFNSMHINNHFNNENSLEDNAIEKDIEEFNSMHINNHFNNEDAINIVEENEKESERNEVVFTQRDDSIKPAVTQPISRNLKCKQFRMHSIHQDIIQNIPFACQNLVLNIYYLWILHGIVMVLNIIGGMILTDLNIIGLGILYLLLSIPVGYLCWFRSAYKAFYFDSSLNYIIFLLVFGCQLLISVVQAVGIPNFGTIGIITIRNKFTEINSTADTVIALILVLIAIGFNFVAAADAYILRQFYGKYRSTGASISIAIAEFKTRFLLNPNERSATFYNVAAAAAELHM